MRAVVAAIVLVSAGCYRPVLRDCTVRCDLKHGCPSPLTCQASGFCAQASVCPSNDAATEANPDGTPGFPPCDPSQRFGPPTLVPGLDPASDPNAQKGNDTSARLSRDELTIFFASDRGTMNGEFELFVATRPTVTDAFRAPTPIAELAATVGETQSPTLTPDGLTMFFESSRTGDFQIFQTSRDTLGSPFQRPQTVDTIDRDNDGGAANQVGAPYVVPGGALYFHELVSSLLHVFRADSQGIRDLSGDLRGAEDAQPLVSDDELTMFFASTRSDPDGGAQGGFDVWIRTRTSVDDDFGSPSVVQEVSTARTDGPTWLSPDGCRLFLQRSDGGLPARIFVAQKPPR
jgi:hypothetical protein